MYFNFYVFETSKILPLLLIRMHFWFDQCIGFQNECMYSRAYKNIWQGPWVHTIERKQCSAPLLPCGPFMYNRATWPKFSFCLGLLLGWISILSSLTVKPLQVHRIKDITSTVRSLDFLARGYKLFWVSKQGTPSNAVGLGLRWAPRNAIASGPRKCTLSNFLLHPRSWVPRGKIISWRRKKLQIW